MLRNLLLCGLIAGASAGLLATGFAEVVGEPAVNQAIAFEDAQGRTAGESPEPALVSRDIQSTFGLLTAAVLYGSALGGLFALVFAGVYGRVARAGPSAMALRLATAAFLVVFLIPFLKYPANPPAVGSPETIGERTLLFLTMIAISVSAAVAGLSIRAATANRIHAAGATAVGVASFLLIVIAAGVAMPGVNEVPDDFPATTLWRFREASVGMQLVLWATIGLLFSVLAQRVMTWKPLLGSEKRAR
ncbi:MAG: CbtA family protein [Thermoleophilaceae bacterium]